MASIRIMDVEISALLCVFLLHWTLHSIQAEKHSLYYIYTGLSKPVDLPGIYEFSAMGLLDDTQIDYYNSKDQRKIPKQQWMKEKMPEDYWEKGTQSRKEKEQWFYLSLKNLMKRRRHDESDLHVLQRRIGCEIEKQGHEFKFSKGVYEFSYDGEDFLSFDNKESQWVAADDTALLTKRKWENEPIINQYTKSYLEKDCVKWLNKYREYADEELRNISAPDVHVFARKCIKEDFKLKLTCMATGVYSKDVMMIIRKNHTSLPEYEMNSTVVQPNHDGSFQIRKTVEIEEDDDDEAEYDCLVSHRTLNESIIVTWDRLCSECPLNTVAAGFVGVVSGGVIMLAISALVFGILVERKNIVITNPRKPAEEKAGVHLEEGQATESLNANAANAEEPLLRKECNKQDTGGETSSSPEKV